MDTEKTPSGDSTPSDKAPKLAWRPLRLKELEIANKTASGGYTTVSEDVNYYIVS
jgi:hypothetical protein